MIIGRDHASPGNDSNGKPFYPPYAAQELVERFSDEVGVRVLPFGEFVYLPEEDRYEDVRRIGAHVATAQLSGTLIRDWYRSGGAELPSWFARPEVAEAITDVYPPRHKQGFCIWFTGLSAAGKSTTAEILTVLLQEYGRQVTLLDGDAVRNNLSRGLGFSKEDRDANIRRIGFVAAEIVKHQGTVVCAAVSPYRATRNDVRNMIGADRFVEVFVNTPIEECERRDVKGMYRKARRGELKNFTGIDDPYEQPVNPELELDTLTESAEDNARRIIAYLKEHRFLAS
jgi:sulfate adenylyltransferase